MGNLLTVSPTIFMYVSTAFVAKVLPLKMRFSFSVTGVCVCVRVCRGEVFHYVR